MIPAFSVLLEVVDTLRAVGVEHVGGGSEMI